MTYPIEQVCDTVRINYGYEGAPWEFSVETLEANGEWKVACTFNEMSDDYAHTNARSFAKRLMPKAPSFPPVLPGVKATNE